MWYWCELSWLMDVWDVYRDDIVLRKHLCHPTFAMTGALAWQVTKILNKKKKVSCCRGEFARGIFFARVLPSCVCVLLLALRTHYLWSRFIHVNSLNTTEIFSIRILRSADLETSWPNLNPTSSNQGTFNFEFKFSVILFICII